uniref:Uncharacterized protein n=1 Tax=Cacopsylla melanoneura TaxID=428564 RepID=A0A8D8TJC6_9HEMI
MFVPCSFVLLNTFHIFSICFNSKRVTSSLKCVYAFTITLYPFPKNTKRVTSSLQCLCFIMPKIIPTKSYSMIFLTLTIVFYSQFVLTKSTFIYDVIKKITLISEV